MALSHMTATQLAAWAALGLFPAMMVFAALMDLMTMQIRNHLVIALVLAWGVLAPLAGLELEAMAASAAVAALVFLIGFGLFCLGWIGGGDAKLAAATVLWLGSGQTLPYLVYTALIGGAIAGLILAFRKVPLPADWQDGWVARLHAPDTGVPYGAAMAPAALLVFPHTAWVTAMV